MFAIALAWHCNVVCHLFCSRHGKNIAKQCRCIVVAWSLQTRAKEMAASFSSAIFVTMMAMMMLAAMMMMMMMIRVGGDGG